MTLSRRMGLASAPPRWCSQRLIEPNTALYSMAGPARAIAFTDG